MRRQGSERGPASLSKGNSSLHSHLVVCRVQALCGHYGSCVRSREWIMRSTAGGVLNVLLRNLEYYGHCFYLLNYLSQAKEF